MSPFVFVLAGALLALAPSAVLCLEDPPTRAAETQNLPWSSPALLVGDVDAAASWYEGMLGFERVGDRMDGTSRTVILSRGLTIISLRPIAVETTGSVSSPRPALRADLTVLVDDVDSVVTDLADSGVSVLSWPEDDADGRDRTAIVADADGNRIVLREPLPQGS